MRGRFQRSLLILRRFSLAAVRKVRLVAGLLFWVIPDLILALLCRGVNVPCCFQVAGFNFCLFLFKAFATLVPSVEWRGIRCQLSFILIFKMFARSLADYAFMLPILLFCCCVTNNAVTLPRLLSTRCLLCMLRGSSHQRKGV